MKIFDWLTNALTATTPAQVEPARLPHWARVAFAARCARSVQPIFLKDWPDAEQRHIKSLKRAISLAENSAAKGSPTGDSRKAVTHAMRAAGASLIHEKITASQAASAARVAAEAVEHGATESITKAAEAFGYACELAQETNQTNIISALCRDFDALAAFFKKAPWSDSTPVPKDIFDS
jgi:hypothetical protein